MTLAMLKKQRLVVVSEHYEPETGATAQLITDLVSSLVLREWEVTVLTSTPGGRLAYSVNRLFKYRKASISIIGKSVSGIWFFLKSLGWLFNHSKAGDVLLIVSNPPFIGFLGPLAKILCRTPYIYVFQDLFPRSAILSRVIPAKGPIPYFWQALTNYVCTHSASVVVLSESMRERLKCELKTDLIPIEVIPNWAVERGLPLKRQENRFAAEHKFQDLFTIQYSGNFGRLHDLKTLLEAARILKDSPIKFVFIGDGAKRTEVELYQQTYNLKNVLKLPYQPRKLLPESLAACDLSVVGLVPGAEDTVAPCKFYGILASGRGVVLIARKSCDLSQLVIREQCGIVIEPGEARELAKKLNILRNEPAKVAAMGQRSLELYAEQFGIERSVDRYEKLLEGIS